MNKKLNGIVIVGSTAVGKSSFALPLAEILNGEIVVADSMQVYKGMDVGTAKPTIEEQKKVKHHCIDLIFPIQKFDVFQFKDIAKKSIMEFSIQ